MPAGTRLIDRAHKTWRRTRACPSTKSRICSSGRLAQPCSRGLSSSINRLGLPKYGGTLAACSSLLISVASPETALKPTSGPNVWAVTVPGPRKHLQLWRLTRERSCHQCAISQVAWRCRAWTAVLKSRLKPIQEHTQLHKPCLKSGEALECERNTSTTGGVSLVETPFHWWQRSFAQNG